MSAFTVPALTLSSSAFALLMTAFFVLAMGQALHVSYQLSWRVRLLPHAGYEVLLVIHLLCGFCMARAGLQGFPPEVMGPLRSLLLLFEAVLGVWGVTLAVLSRRATMVPELACILATLPACAVESTAWVAPVLVVDAVVMAGRVAAALMTDERTRRARPGRDAMAEAVRLLPEGVLCTSGEDGRVLFMNDAMRARLVALGLPCDLADLRDVWGLLEERARRDAGCDAMFPEGLHIEVAPGNTCLFMCSKSVLRGRSCRWIVAIDVTEEERASAEIAQATRVLERASDELRQALSDVDEVARNEALVSMHARVHDVIGQRLSILHRYIEDGAPDASLRQVSALISGMSAELRAEDAPQAAVELAAVVDAFGLAGVEVRVEGELPEDPEIAQLFVQVIRECTTNAVRHGRSRAVDVHMGETRGAADARWAARGDSPGLQPTGLSPSPGVNRHAWLTVSNDGTACKGAPRLGGGLSGMRAATLRLGGSFTVCAGPPFTVHIDVACPSSRVCAGDADERRAR